MKLDELAARAEQNSLALLELERTTRTVEEASEAETDSESDEVLGRLYELHQEQENIRREAEVLENPKLRAALSSKAASARKRVQESLTREAGILLVWTAVWPGMSSSSAVLENTRSPVLALSPGEDPSWPGDSRRRRRTAVSSSLRATRPPSY